MPVPKFHTNPWRHDATPSALHHETVQPDGTIVATYEDGHTATFSPDDGTLKLEHRPEFPGGDKTARKLEGLHNQLHQVTKRSDSYM